MTNKKVEKKDKRAQTNVLVISLIVIGIVVSLIVFYNIIKFSTRESSDTGLGELAVIKPRNSCDLDESCDDENDCTEDICEYGRCKYEEKEADTICSLSGKNRKNAKGVCKEGKCVSA